MTMRDCFLHARLYIVQRLSKDSDQWLCELQFAQHLLPFLECSFTDILVGKEDDIENINNWFDLRFLGKKRRYETSTTSRAQLTVDERALR